MKTNRMIGWMLAAVVAVSGEAVTVRVDWTQETGPVKPVNGVGQPPMIDALVGAPLFRYLKDAGVPYARLHDVGGWLGGGLYVDIPNLFPDFDADENDPKNYRFAFTDGLLVNLEKNGVEPFFRLGVTIENFIEYIKPGRYPVQRLDPPKDFAKWGRICEHVIRHYTEGWADGYRMKIAYWEIWNEPDGNPIQERNCLWNAPFAEYVKMYGIVATHLKAKFPHLKIGGYGSCGFYAGVGSDHVPAANSSPRMTHFIDCATNFLAAAKAGGWPLDFFSFHSYSSPREVMRQVRYADELLDAYGFTANRTERIFDEWLPYVSQENLGSALQAAGVAAELIGLQNGPCRVACIYDARCGVGPYSPLFNPLTLKPHKAYYAFTAFNELRRRGTAVRATCDDADVYVAAAKGKEDAAVMVANDSDRELPLAFELAGRRPVLHRMTDAGRTDSSQPGVPPVLPARSFCVLLVQ